MIFCLVACLASAINRLWLRKLRDVGANWWNTTSKHVALIPLMVFILEEQRSVRPHQLNHLFFHSVSRNCNTYWFELGRIIWFFIVPLETIIRARIGLIWKVDKSDAREWCLLVCDLTIPTQQEKTWEINEELILETNQDQMTRTQACPRCCARHTCNDARTFKPCLSVFVRRGF